MLSLLVCFALVSGINTQNKPNLYIFFKEDTSERVFKRFKYESEKNGRQYKYDLYDIYLHVASGAKYQFSTKNGTKAFVVNQSYISRIQPKSLSWLRSRDSGFWPTWNKRFPYKHLFLVEKLPGAQYRITEVETFIGEDF